MIQPLSNLFKLIPCCNIISKLLSFSSNCKKSVWTSLLKTPIASVRLAAESALTSLERDDGMTKTFLEQILRDSDRMNELISDLLDLSAMESSDVFMESFDLHDVIANEVSYLSKQNKKRIGYKKKKVEIYANFEKELNKLI